MLSSTGNYIAHYKARHKVDVPAVEEYLKKPTKPILATKVRQPGIIDAFSSKCSADTVLQSLIVFQTLFAYLFHINKLLNYNNFYFQIAKKILDFIVDANLSFNVSQIPSLHALLETVAGRKLDVPTRYKIMTTLDSEFEIMKTCLKKLLANQKYLCVTADIWTSHAQSYLGVTVHFIDESFVRHSFLLAFKQMKQRQTYDVLAKALDDIFQDFGIAHSQITNIVTDGGSAFCKMFKKYGDQIDSIVIDTNGDEIDGETDDVQTETSEDGVAFRQSTIVDEHGNEFVSEIITMNIQADEPNRTTESQNDAETFNYFEESGSVFTPEVH